MHESGRSRLTPQDWAAAALRALARGGVAAVAVESVAADLGATKGSFYWHFKNRDALVEAALTLWEQRSTDAMIAEFERIAEPAGRLKAILTTAFEGQPDRAEIALLGNPDHPAALRAVRRVAERRIGYIAEQFERLGWDERQARDRSVVAYYLYVGHLQMAHVAPHTADRNSRQRQLDLIVDALITTERAPAANRGRPRAV